MPQMAGKIDRGKQQIANLLFQLLLVYHRLLGFVHHFIQLFIHFAYDRPQGVPVEADRGTALLDFMSLHQRR
ncbi:hypothetical protein D3C71_2075570 [compost metagenome]